MISVYLYTSLPFTGAIRTIIGSGIFDGQSSTLRVGLSAQQVLGNVLSRVTTVQPGQPEPGLAIPAIFPFGNLRVGLRHE